METLVLLIPGIPLAAFAAQFFLGRRLPRQGDVLAVAAMAASLLCAAIVLARAFGGEGFERVYAWFTTGFVTFGAGIRVDGLTAVMLVVVTLVSFLVHVFSVGYLHGDRNYPTYFAWLLFFTVAMLGLVLADNFFVLYVFWELVGFASYRLIGFWRERQEPADAARKAFITTRVGDVGMFIGILLIYSSTGTFSFEGLEAAVKDGTFAGDVRLLAGLGVFAGAMGKSAQLPLHVWLPDAMEGPTPVSALIHAATMVAAGVYLTARSFFLLDGTSGALVVACIGGFTAFFAATIAMAQNDVKKVLAYSTISQLGYMMLAIGVGGVRAGLFHLATHACFKALLFLGSGSVIHATHTQDMREMGGLRRKMPVTYATFGIGVAAISGVPLLSGFFSKDAILASTWSFGATHPLGYALFALALLTAGLTAFYMTRAFALTFLGEPRDAAKHAHAHESPPVMTVPLVALAVLSVVAGWRFLGIESLLPADVREAAHGLGVPAAAILAAAVGILAGWRLFATEHPLRARLRAAFGPLATGAERKWYVDEAYDRAFVRPAYDLARAAARFDLLVIDRTVDAAGEAALETGFASGRADLNVVDGAVSGTGETTLRAGAAVARLQTGRIRNYLLGAVATVAAALIVVVFFLR